MKWASAIREGTDLSAAVAECAADVAAQLGPEGPASLVCVFASGAYGGALDGLLAGVPEQLAPRFPGATILGCSAAGVIGGGREIEDRPAVSLTAGYLPGVQITPLRVGEEDLPTPDDPPGAWVRLVGVEPAARPHFLLMMDPYTAPAQELLAGLDFAFPAANKVGGIASGGWSAGSHALWLNRQTYIDGVVGVALTGEIAVDTVVAQGCRPIGEPKRITRCEQNILLELDGQAPLAYLQELYRRLPRRDQALLSRNLFLGIAIDPLLTMGDVSPGDFLIRNVIGADQGRGILAIGEQLREGQLVQFHVRDAVTSAEDLQRQLERYLAGQGRPGPAGALLFQCNGRGRHLYGRPNHDTELFARTAGDVPLGGFFCNGEIGPVGGTTYLHGYTSSFAVFRKP